MELGFATASGKMMATEPSKPASDKKIEPIIDGASTNPKALGDLVGTVPLVQPQETFGNFEKAQMIESLSHPLFIFKPLDSCVSTGDSHHGPRLDRAPLYRDNRGYLQAMVLGCPKDTGFCPFCEALISLNRRVLSVQLFG
jgi:hypothetical protein